MSSVYPQPVEKASVQIRTNEYLYEFEPDKLEFSSSSNGVSFSGWTWGLTVTKREEEMNCDIPELHYEDLQAIGRVTEFLDDVAAVRGIHAVEIRIKTEDPTAWAVIGYSEAGDPALLRFEKDK